MYKTFPINCNKQTTFAILRLLEWMKINRVHKKFYLQCAIRFKSSTIRSESTKSERHCSKFHQFSLDFKRFDWRNKWSLFNGGLQSFLISLFPRWHYQSPWIFSSATDGSRIFNSADDGSLYRLFHRSIIHTPFRNWLDFHVRDINLDFIFGPANFWCHLWRSNHEWRGIRCQFIFIFYVYAIFRKLLITRARIFPHIKKLFYWWNIFKAGWKVWWSEQSS